MSSFPEILTEKEDKLSSLLYGIPIHHVSYFIQYPGLQHQAQPTTSAICLTESFQEDTKTE